MESGQAAVLSGVVEQGVIFLQDDTHFKPRHYYRYVCAELMRLY
jgi:hypothetical protein